MSQGRLTPIALKRLWANAEFVAREQIYFVGSPGSLERLILFSLDFMFPRAAVVVLGFLIAAIVALFVRAEFVAQRARCVVTCNRGIAQPYRQVLARMRHSRKQVKPRKFAGS